MPYKAVLKTGLHRPGRPLSGMPRKTGSTARGERTAKYNRLLEIENELVYGEYLGSQLFN